MSIYCFYWSTLDIWYYITFQVGYVVTWYLYISWNVHHDEASNNLPPYKVIIILLTIFIVLYITPSWLIFYIWMFIPLNSTHHFSQHPHSSPLWWPFVCFSHLWVCCITLFTCFLFNIPCISEIIWCLYLSDLFHLT